MKIIRVVMLLWLSLMLPVSGLASSGLTGQCPMQDDAMSLSASGAECGDMAMHDMNSKNAVQKAPCNMDAQCHFGGLYHPVSAPETHSSPELSYLTPLYSASPQVGSTDNNWRPPRVV